MFKFLSSIKCDYTCAQISSVEERIVKLEEYIKECKQRSYDLEREMDHYEDQLTKAMEKRLDLFDKMDAAATTSTIFKKSQRLA